jgi:hypothetical protein
MSPAMMIAQIISNSWSKLLTLCCLPPLPASPRTTATHVCPQNEHFCTELAEFLCHHNFVRLRRNAELTMDIVLHSILVRVRSLRAFIAASLRKMLGMDARDGDFASQRVCPSCGLITPRYETCCLECGKALKPA